MLRGLVSERVTYCSCRLLAMTDPFSSDDITGIEAAPRMTASRWQRSLVEAWRAENRSESALRSSLAMSFSSAVGAVFARETSDRRVAALVADSLRTTLSSCDALAFDDNASTLAYLLWHQVDRYHRVGEALDSLFERGVLPIAKADRSLKVLEVGSGPAPASYAVAHYYTALGMWSRMVDSNFEISMGVDLHTIDRGSAWGSLVHTLSEELPAHGGRPSRVRLFGTTYDELAGFSPMRTHVEAREHHKRVSLQDDESWLYRSQLEYEELERAAAATAPASAYDMIVVSNFLTNAEMLENLRGDLEVLANSLVPGGVLMALSGTGPKYVDMWRDFGALSSVKRLDHVADEIVQTHSDSDTHRRVAAALLQGLRHLRSVVPSSMSEVELPRDVERALQVASSASDGIATSELSYPAFQLHAFKRGNRAISKKDRDRIARRRAGRRR